MFTDRIKISVHAGNGGNGSESCYRRTDRKVIPNGGDGGNGGSVIFRADTNAPNLKEIRYKRLLQAESGAHGGSNHKRGRNGEDLIVLLPFGCRIYDLGRNLLLRELKNSGDEVVIAAGGKGGSGNQTGRTAVPGERGAKLELEITLRLPADVFLVGLPNSGKSRLMNVLTHSKVKEDAYPFATPKPELGVVKLSDYEQVTLCEMPSIYAHSHEGRGHGTDFLKHLEAAPLIAYCLSPDSEFCESLSDGLRILKKQLEQYNPEYARSEAVVLVNKMDLPGSKKKTGRFKPPHPVFYLSAVTRQGVPEFLEYLRKKFTGKI